MLKSRITGTCAETEARAAAATILSTRGEGRLLQQTSRPVSHLARAEGAGRGCFQSAVFSTGAARSNPTASDTEHRSELDEASHPIRNCEAHEDLREMLHERQRKCVSFLGTSPH